MSERKTCSYAVKNIGKETDGSCNAPAVRKYSSEMPLCRLHFYMRKCELLEDEIEELLNEELVCEYCDSVETEVPDYSPIDAAQEFYEENDLQGLRDKRDYQDDIWESDESLVQPLQHDGCQSWQGTSEDYFEFHRSHMVMAMKCRACDTDLYSKDQLKKKQ